MPGGPGDPGGGGTENGRALNTTRASGDQTGLKTWNAATHGGRLFVRAK